MTAEWGRIDGAGQWLTPRPVWTVAAFIVAVTSAVAVALVTYATWSPLERFYLPTYLRSALLAQLGGPRTGTYRLLEVSNRRGSRLALDEEVAPLTGPAGECAWALTRAARDAGDDALAWHDASYPHAALHDLLRRWIYRDRGLLERLRPAFVAGLAVLVGSLAFGLPTDLARRRTSRTGRRLKGPELLSVAQFSARIASDGVEFQVVPSLASRLLHRPSAVHIPQRLESSHLLIMGDTGAGKSSLIRQLLQQVEWRHETAIVYDPAREYTPQFYTPDRGDQILNPLDARSPAWRPADELQHETEALTIASSLFSDRPHDPPFFVEAPRRIFAHLLTLRPTADELATWLCHEEEIDRRVAGTPYAKMIDAHAPAQRSGVLGSLNMVADALQLLPPVHQTVATWSAVDWSAHRKGWLFFTSTPETRDRLLPLISLWLDLLVLRLMNQGQPHPRRVWIVLDELASLQRLPQLHTAITEARKANTPVVLGFQGRSQLETRYGHDAEVMLSQPATKVFLRTSEPHAARWVSESIGDVEIERLAESRSSGATPTRASTNYGLHRQVEPLVMPSEISGLPDLRGYMKLGNVVVRLHLPYIDLPQRCPGLVRRGPQQPAAAGARAARLGTQSPEVMPSATWVAHDRDTKRPGHELGRDHRFK